MKPIQVLAGVAILIVVIGVVGLMFFKTPQAELEQITSEPLTESTVAPAPLCDDEERPCLEIHFDGENCLVAGPTGTHTGMFVFMYVNESDEITRFEAIRIDENKSIQDLSDFAEFSPRNMMQSWMHRSGFWERVVIPGKTVTFEASLSQPGDYGILCYKEPPYAVFGGGFILEEE